MERERKIVRDLPVTPVKPVTNGHAAAAGLVSFSEAQRRKELALARIRESEADQATGELIPTARVIQWLRHIYVPFVGGMRGIPDELHDMLGPRACRPPAARGARS